MFAIVSWVIIFIVYLYLHEFAGHYLTNLICGIHINQMMVNWDLFFPLGITITDSNISPPRISYFMGGAVAALIILSFSLICYIIYKRKTNEHLFLLFSNGIGFVCMGVIETFTEPFFPKYHGTLIDGIILLIVSITVPIVINKIHHRKYNLRNS